MTASPRSAGETPEDGQVGVASREVRALLRSRRADPAEQLVWSERVDEDAGRPARRVHALDAGRQFDLPARRIDDHARVGGGAHLQAGQRDGQQETDGDPHQSRATITSEALMTA